MYISLCVAACSAAPSVHVITCSRLRVSVCVPSNKQKACITTTYIHTYIHTCIHT